MFENKKTKEGNYYTRYIISWINTCIAMKQEIYFDNLFEEWLRNNGCTEDEISNIFRLATYGKLELERNAREFIEKKGGTKYGE